MNEILGAVFVCTQHHNYGIVDKRTIEIMLLLVAVVDDVFFFHSPSFVHRSQMKMKTHTSPNGMQSKSRA